MAAICKILAFAGSTRTDSFNKKLLSIAAAGARAAAADVTVIDLKDYPLPIYDGDLEAADGLPDTARKLKDIFLAHQGLLIASPEYNSSVSAVLKNAIDWVSRPVQGEKPLECFTGKVASIMAASPGGLGGLRGLVALRSILGNIGVIVLPEQLAVSKAHEAFDAGGALKDPKAQETAQRLGANAAKMLFKLQSPE